MGESSRLRQILVLAELGNFRRAAAALRITQPALSKTVRLVEKQLGVRLFDRHARGVTITAPGERVVAYCRGALQAEDDLLHDLALVAGADVGRVDAALGPYPSVVSGYPAAARLCRDHPRLAVGLRVLNWRAVIKAVTDRQVDLGIADLNDARENEDLQVEEFGVHHRAQLFCRPGHPILRRKPIATKDLFDFPWATTRFPPRVAAAIPRPPGRAGWIDPALGDFVPAIEIDVPMQLGVLAHHTDCLALGAFGLVEHDLRAGALDVVPIALDLRAGYGFMWLRHRSLTPPALAYMQAVRDEERAFAEREARLAATFLPRRLRGRRAR